MLIFILTIIGGLAIGTVMGLLGSGAGLLAIPILIHWVGYTPANAMGASLLIVFFAALSSLWRTRAKNFSLPHTIFYGTCTSLFSFTSATFAPTFSTALRCGIFIVMLTLASTAIFLRSKKTSPKKKPYQILFHFFPASLIGFISGLIGVGGGFLIVPTLHRYGSLSLQAAINTSVIIVLCSSGFAFLGALPSLYSSHLYWPPLFVLTFTSIFSAQWATHWRSQINTKYLRFIFSGLLLCLAIFEMLYCAMD